MKEFTSTELRKAWINFYKERGHVDVGAVSLVSDGSTGAMFNVAGMQPIMPYLLGKKHPMGTRLCNVQGCVRTNDIDGIGDKSHLTFFEMMGSWSLGDYFKEERCKWSYELLTGLFGFDRDHLAATVFAGDENAPRDEEGAKYRIESGFKKENVFYLPAEDNWWGLEFGPCGPDSEMFYVSDVPPCGPDCRPGCHCGKYTEIGNDVFMQYEKHQDGHLTPLAQKNVDTGWGLERNLAFLNGIDDVYKTDLFTAAIACIEKASGIKYDSDEKMTRSMRILADHIRTSVMLIGDEAKLLPSNTGAGYVLRRLIRRAVRHGRILGLKKEDLLAVAATFIDDVYAESYPLLVKNKDFVLRELEQEVLRFDSTIENGMKEFKKILSDVKKSEKSEIAGEDAFYLYDTFGFPLELTIEMAEEEKLTVDEKGFAASMEAQKTKARANANFSQKTADASVFDAMPAGETSTFIGYDRLNCDSSILAIANEEGLTEEANEGDSVTIITKETTFYATMGGQKGDRGSITTDSGEVEISDTVKIPGGRIGHIGVVTKGVIRKGMNASLKVCEASRRATSKNHSATHLLQGALQELFGDSVTQQGSYQDTERTRFDFSYSKAMTKEEIARAEAIVNEQIAANLPVVTDIMSIEDAKKTGAMALFGEKYGDTVRVVSMGDFSKELCGGTHVSNTGEIQAFKIISEASVSSGVRRIEAITGANVAKYYAEMEQKLEEAAREAKTSVNELVSKIASMQAQIKSLTSEVEALKSKAAKEGLGNVMDQVCEVKGISFLGVSLKDVDMNELRNLSDDLKNKLGSGVVVLASAQGADKVNLIVTATEDLLSKGVHAGNLVKAAAPMIGGGGGGRPNMAQAGGKNPSGIEDAIRVAKETLLSQLS